MSSRERRNLRNGLLFILPWILGFAAFIAYPLGASLYYSFCDYSVLKPPVWVGSANFQDLFTDRKVPRERRATAPVVVCGGEIAWVGGVGAAEGYEALRLTWRR